MTTIELLNVSISVSLFTLIWLIQILHYPLFSYLNTERCHESMLFHQRRISYLVIPLMLGEVAVTGYTVVLGMPGSLACAVIVFLVWATTFYFQVPLHSKLVKKINEETIRTLVATNWIRTFLWTLKLIIVVGGILNN